MSSGTISDSSSLWGWGTSSSISADAGVLRGGGSLLANIPIRVRLRESHNFSSRATQYAIQNGNSISDHIIDMPVTLDIQFEMTNTDGGVQMALEAFQRLVELKRERKRLNVETEHASYKNMVIVGFNPDHRAPNKGAFRAVIRLQQVGIIGETNVVSAPGGRPEGLLADDGTNKTAVTGRSDGVVNTLSDNPILTKSLGYLGLLSTVTSYASINTGN